MPKQKYVDFDPIKAIMIRYMLFSDVLQTMTVIDLCTRRSIGFHFCFGNYFLKMFVCLTVNFIFLMALPPNSETSK